MANWTTLILFVCAATAGISIIMSGVTVNRGGGLTAPPAANPGYLDAATCCRYTHANLPATLAELRTFVRNTVYGNTRFAHRTGLWADFVSVLPDLETAYVNNTYLQDLVTLRAKVVVIMAGNSDSLEDVNLLLYKNELDLLLNLTAIDAYFMQTSIAYWDEGLIDDPFSTAADVIALLPTFDDEDDFVDRVLSWLSDLDAKATRWVLMAARSLAANHTHSNYVVQRQNVLANGHGYQHAFAANYTTFCLSTMAGADLTECLTLAESIESTLDDYADWWNNTYLDACSTTRPNTSPGLRNVTDGAAIYDILKMYHLGALPTDDALYNIGNAGVTAALAEYDILAPGLGFGLADGAALLTHLGQQNDAHFYMCSNLTSVPIDAAMMEIALVADAVPSQLSFLPRSGGALSVTASGRFETSYQSGLYNASTHDWTTAANYNIGRLGSCTGTGFYYYDKVSLRASVAHHILFGHGPQVGLATELDCSLADLPSISVSRNGWALFAELLGFEAGIYDSNYTLVGYYRSRALGDNRLMEDTCVHSSTLNSTVGGCTVTTATDLSAAAGYHPDVGAIELTRILAAPGQALSYRYGDKLLQDLRTNLTATLAPANITLLANEYNNLFLRFGAPDLVRQFTPLVATYAKLALANTTTSADWGRDLVPSRLFSSCNPRVGRGRDATCEAAADLRLIKAGRA